MFEDVQKACRTVSGERLRSNKSGSEVLDLIFKAYVGSGDLNVTIQQYYLTLLVCKPDLEKEIYGI